MKYAILIILLGVCVFLTVSLVRSIIDYAKKKKEKKQDIEKENTMEVNADVNNYSNGND